MRILTGILLLFISDILPAQFCDTCYYKDTTRLKLLHLRSFNPGIHTDGINVSIAPTFIPEEYIGSYTVNGIDFAFHSYERVVNGIAVSPFMVEVYNLNGLSLCGGIADHRRVCGVQMTGLCTFIYDTLSGVSINGLTVSGYDGKGVSLSGIANVYHGRFSGLLFSGTYNRVREGFSGVAITPGIQVYDEYAKGIVLSGIGTYTDYEAKGVFVSGAITFMRDDFHGLSITPGLNYVKGESHGMQIGFVNHAAVLRGVHLGLVNHSNRIQGVQFGLVNINKANPIWCRVMPLVNFNFRAPGDTDTIRKRGEGNYIVKSYYADGQLGSVKQFQNGKSNGLQIYYNQSGAKFRESNYAGGVKSGMEYEYCDAHLMSSVLWDADTMVWVCEAQFIGDGSIPELIQYDYTTRNYKYSVILLGKDTLINSGLRKNDLHIEAWQEEVLIAVHKNDSTEVMWWCNSKDKAHHVAQQAVQIYPTTSDTVTLTFQSYTNNSPHSAVLRLNDYFFHADSAQCPEVLVTSAYRSEIKLDRYYRRECNQQRSYALTGASDYWPNGNVKSHVEYDCRTQAEVARTDYFSNGEIYYSWKGDTTRFYSAKGKLVREDVRNRCRTYHSNGEVEYEVSPDSLYYFNSSGDLVVYGVRDTLWQFNPGGRVQLRIELRGDSAYIVKYGGYEDGDRDTMQASVCFATGIGAKCAGIVAKEPVPIGIAKDRTADEYFDYWSEYSWFGKSLTRFFTEEQSQQYWIYDGPEYLRPPQE